MLTYDLWMSRKKQRDFSINSHHCGGLEHEFFHTGMPPTMGTDIQSLINSVSVLMKNSNKYIYCCIYLQYRCKIAKVPDLTQKYSKKYKSICKLQAHVSDELPSTCPCSGIQIWCTDSCD